MSREETKQEIIREGIARKLCRNDSLNWEWLKEQQRYKGAKDCEYYFSCADDILEFEDSQGAVLKVDTDLQVLFTDEDKNIISQTKSEWAVVTPLIGDGE